MRQGEIWFVDLNPVRGSEQAGFRPVVVISGNLMNRYLPVVIVVPLTTKIKNYQGNPVIQPDPDPPIPNPIDPILEVKTLPLVARTGVIFSTIIILTTLLGLSFLSLKYLIKKRGGSLSEK